MQRIGLVDDSVMLRSAIKNVLESSGFEVVLEAGGSQELFEKLEKTVPSLILLDVFFPTENGLDILARLKKQYPPIKVLMVTGLKQETISEEAKRLGASGVLYKPFDTDDLLNAIKQA
ncbi:MAG: response regulator transcription factor [Elusimicrobiaceae bacterium]|nr:response regulator transcription factor [Elusimicrobiaceae bacterium]MBR5608719.1 response regulator transcription factor [Elusimicrobiaceae bacterium]